LSPTVSVPLFEFPSLASLTEGGFTIVHESLRYQGGVGYLGAGRLPRLMRRATQPSNMEAEYPAYGRAILTFATRQGNMEPGTPPMALLPAHPPRSRRNHLRRGW